jgi:tetratricopeptide (TPR) repeat protein
MMKNKIFTVLTLGLAALGLSSCNDYLDKLPDERAELNTEEKITQLLVSAYPTCTNNLLVEVLSDNVDDNGRAYSSPAIVDQTYRFIDTTEEGNDSPYDIWGGYYRAVATVNEALQAVEAMGNPASLQGDVAEAKLIRAYSMFMLAQTFCMAWNPEKADEYLGLPYPLIPEQDLTAQYERGTLRELYEKIDKDIEEALPHIAEAAQNYSQPKYHFNVKAAYAFASRFNLYYMNYEKCIKYANMVLGNDPTAVMRDYEPYRELGRTDFANLWIRSTDQANIMMLATYSIAPRYLTWATSSRFAHNYDITAYETFWVDMPWGSGSSANSIIYANHLYGSNQCVAFPTYEEQFEYTDKVAGIGYTHSVDPIFTGDVSILERAEAYCLLGQLDNAMKDINTWIGTHCKDKFEDGELVMAAPQNLTVADIVAFVTNTDYAKRTPDGWRDRSFRKHMHPQGFTIGAEGSEQECMLQFLLHMKRIETVFHGFRMQDVKRYGIEYTHEVVGEDPLVFIRGDLRGAVQIPNTVVAAGLQENPRQSADEIKAFVNATEAEYADPEEEEDE